MKHLLTIVLSLTWVLPRAFAENFEPTPLGLEIFYQKTATPDDREQVRKRFNLKLVYFSKRFFSESVNLPETPTNQDPRLLAEVCRRLRNEPLIEFCEVYYPPMHGFVTSNLPLIQLSPQCSSFLQSLPFGENLRRLENNLEAIDPSNRCSPLPAMSDFAAPTTITTVNPNRPRYDRYRERWTDCDTVNHTYDESDPMHPLNDPRCEQDRLSPLFAQEAIGAPEVEEFLRQQQARVREQKLASAQQLDRSDSRLSQRLPIGIIDSRFGRPGTQMDAIPSLTRGMRACLLAAQAQSVETGTVATEELNQCGIYLTGEGRSHGVRVAELIAGPPPVRSGPRALVAQVAATNLGHDSAAFDHMLDNPPPLVNLSMIFYSESSRRRMEALSRETTTVICAGNQFPAPITPSNLEGDIIVGSLEPNGSPSYFSQEGEEVTISVPFDFGLGYSWEYQDENDPGRRPVHFGGTSAATPLVTGALSNVKLLLPGITDQELRILLQSTAIPTVGSLVSGNGAGSLNSYALLKSAHSLAENWPGNRQEIRNSNFMARLQPQAAQEATFGLAFLATKTNCTDFQKGLAHLRKAFFLNPHDPNVRRALADVYRALGHEQQARFYDLPERTMLAEDIYQGLANRSLIRALARGDLRAVREALSQGADARTAIGRHRHGTTIVQITPLQVLENYAPNSPDRVEIERLIRLELNRE